MYIALKDVQTLDCSICEKRVEFLDVRNSSRI